MYLLEVDGQAQVSSSDISEVLAPAQTLNDSREGEGQDQ